MNLSPFNLEAALRGEPVWHVDRKLYIDNVTRVGNRVAFTIAEDGDTIYSATSDGRKTGDYDNVVLAMRRKSTTVYINIWDSPSFHYTKYGTEEAARTASGCTYSGRRHRKLNADPIKIEYEIE